MKNEPKDKEKAFFRSLSIPVATALAVGGIAPWWVELIKDGEKIPEHEEQISSVDNSNYLQAEENVNIDDSINI